MPRSIDVTADSTETVERIHSAYCDESYWLARIAAFSGVTSLDSLDVGADGTVIVVTTQNMIHDMLPRSLAKVYPGDITIVRNEKWTPIGDRRVRGEINAAASGAPGSCVGSALLAPIPSGSRLDFTATVSVKLPLVGGRIEGYIGGQLVEGIPAIQRFTTEWVTENA
jgi:Protein of unknown function (DUF2505)